jgi:hypothetical protein
VKEIILCADCHDSANECMRMARRRRYKDEWMNHRPMLLVMQTRSQIIVGMGRKDVTVGP